MSRSHRKALIAAIFVVPVLCCFIGIGALLIVVFWWGMHGFGFTGPLNTVPLEKTPDWSPWVRLLGRGPTADRIIDIAHERLRRPAPADGVLFQYLHNRHGHLAFFVGQRSKKGWWYGSFQKFCNTAHGGNGEQRGILGLRAIHFALPPTISCGHRNAGIPVACASGGGSIPHRCPCRFCHRQGISRRIWRVSVPVPVWIGLCSVRTSFRSHSCVASVTDNTTSCVW